MLKASPAYSKQTGFITYILLLLIVLTIPIGLYAVRRQQLIGSKAAQPLTDASSSASAKSCSACSADTNKDGVVTVDDMAIVKSCIVKSTNRSACTRADNNTSGIIDQADLTCVKEQLEKRCTVVRSESNTDPKNKLLF